MAAPSSSNAPQLTASAGTMYAELRRANVGTDSNSSASQPTASAGTSADVHHAADAFPDTTVAQMQH